MKSFLTLQGLEGNVAKYAIALIANKRIYAAILGAYYLTIPGVTPSWVGTILLISSLAGFFFEIPSGYIADKLGHKNGLIVWAVATTLSSFFFLISNSIPLLILGGVFLSIGQSFLSGTGTAFLHETLRALKREREFREVHGKVKSIGFGIPILLSVLAPFLVSISWHAPFAISLVLDIIGVIVVSSLVVPPVPQERIEEVRASNLAQVMREAYRLHFFRYALFSGILGGTLFAVSVFRPVYQSVLSVPVIWYGVFFGIGRGLASILLWHSGSMQRILGTPVRIYGMKLALFFVLIAMLSVSDNAWLVVGTFILINAFQWGLTGVGYSVEATGKSAFKATLLSVKSQIQKLTEAGSALILGLLIDRIGYQHAFLIIAVGTLIVLLPLLYSIVCDTRNKLADGAGDDGGE